jgi:hypothetical protein
VKPYYATRALRFRCSGCNHCCTGAHPDYYIEVSPVEAERIRKHLKLSLAWFRRRYLYRFADGIEARAAVHGRTVRGFDDGVLSLRMEDGRCVFLDPQRGCRIYALRPAQCRHYPVWPELVTSAAAWRLEARRCEGIGQGTAIPLARIRRLLRAQTAQ